MKKTLLILALAAFGAGSVQAGDYYCDRDLERQLERIERQQEEILEAQERAEEKAELSKRVEYWERVLDVDLSYMK